jgi:serine protease AprX
VAAGEAYGHVYGPAYEANIILCKTEDLRSETQVEEDNWVAALEFADSIGTDVITTSLGYMTFDTGVSYTYADMDGQTATISIAAGTCDGLGIVMCNSMGNSGPSAGSLTAPADAFNILAVGNVQLSGTIAASSSRGPSYDGRTKPEVCALGTSVACASPGGDSSYTSASGTSLSTPLIAGAACLVIQAHPNWTPSEVREALKMTADRAATPDNTYGWGVINVMAAIAWNPHAGCCVDATVGNLDHSADGLVTMSDMTVLIDHLFISLAPLDCEEDANLDLSADGLVTMGDLTVMIDHLFISLGPLPPCP